MLKNRICEKDLLINIGDENIFKKYFGDFVIGKSYCSKIRNDSNPSVGFFIGGDGRLIYNDFASDHSFKSIDYVAHIYNINYRQAIEQIANDFNLTQTNINRTAINTLPTIKVKEKPKKVIRIIAKKWDFDALAFWATFGIDEKELEKNKIFNVSRVFVNDWEIKDEGYLRFGFYLRGLEGEEYIKVYVPQHLEKSKKWISTCPMKLFFGLENLSFETKTLIIAKSVKEMLILKKLFKDVISIQAENKGALSEESVSFFKNNYEKVIYFGDNDETGINIGNLFSNKFGFTFIHFPTLFKIKYNIKDLGDFTKKWGVKYLKKYLETLNVGIMKNI